MHVIAAAAAAATLLVVAATAAVVQTGEGTEKKMCTSCARQSDSASDAAPALAPAPALASAPLASGAVHPMAAYYTLRPVLPVKPAFFPPLVDPNAYVDRKAWILSNLFGAPAPVASQAGVGTTPAQTPAIPYFGPGYFAAKKNSFLNALFAGQPPTAAQSPALTSQARRALPPAGGFPFAPSVFAAKKAAFLQKLFETLNATAAPPAPSAAQQPSWMDLLDAPDAAQPAEQVPLARVPLSPVIPSYYTDKKTEFLGQLFDSLGLPPPPAAPRATVVPPSFWSPFAVPPSVKPTIVPPGFWTPTGIVSPGFVYKQKVAEFLGKLFQQLNATAENATTADTEKRNLAANDEKGAGQEGPAESQGEPSVTRRSIGPFGGAMGFGKPFAGGAVDPQFFVEKKNAFLSKLFASKGVTGSADGTTGASGSVGSPFGGPLGFAKPFPGAAVDPQVFVDKKSEFLNKLLASKSASASGDGADASSPAAFWGQYGGFYPTAKPTIVPPDFWNPYPVGKTPAFASENGVEESSPPAFWGQFGGFYPTPKPTIVPPDFWNPFPAGKNPAAASGPLFGPKVKPTIVPPDFWAPSFASTKTGSAFVDKKVQILDSLFGAQTTAPSSLPQQPQQSSFPQPPGQGQQPSQSIQPLQPQQPQLVIEPPIFEDPITEEDSLWNNFLKELAEALAAPVHTTYLSKRGISSEAARQQLQDSAVTQLSAIKDDMLSTVNAILKQKASAAQAPAFPYGKSMYAAYGAAKKAGGAGGPPGGKKGGPPGKGGFPFWGGPPAAPTPDPTEPLQQRLQVLSTAFDALASLQRDASTALGATSVSPPSATYSYAPAPVAYAYPPAATTPNADAAALLALLRQAVEKNAASDGASGEKLKSRTKGGKTAARSVQFAVRQGQLSLPAGAEELLTAGGGATPGDHEGGGLQLQIKVPVRGQAQ